jgi:hypothetical protein
MNVHVEQYVKVKHVPIRNLHESFVGRKEIETTLPTKNPFYTKQDALDFWKDTLCCHGVMFASDSARGSGKKIFHVVRSKEHEIVIPWDLKVPRAVPSYYEIILHDLPCRAYIDIDFKCAQVLEKQNALLCRETLEQRLIAFLQRQNIDKASLTHLLTCVAPSTDNKKISMHATASFCDTQGNEYLWRSNTHVAAAFGITRFAEGDLACDKVFGVNGAQSLFAGDSCVIDLAVYDTDRLFRTYGSSKLTQNRPLKEARLYNVKANTFVEMSDTTEEERAIILQHAFVTQTQRGIAGEMYTADTYTTKKRTRSIGAGGSVKRMKDQDLCRVVSVPLVQFVTDSVITSTGYKAFKVKNRMVDKDMHIYFKQDESKKTEPVMCINEHTEKHEMKDFCVRLGQNRSLWLYCQRTDKPIRLGRLPMEIKMPK